MSTVLAAAKALIGRGIIGPVSVRIEDGRIVEVAEGATHDVGAGLLTPGLVDIQVNGAFGADFAEIDEEGMRRIVSDLPRTGVTRFLPTLITADLSQLLEQARIVLNAVSTVNGQGARSLGVHLEGPFLSTKRPGVHDPSLMVAPTPERVAAMLELPSLRMVTLAPELPGALDAIRQLTAAGVLVAVGHTDATGAQTTDAADAGAGMITHLFNAQRGLGHREPGVPGVALVDDRYTLGLIADLAHVGADACRLVFRAAGDRVALVTDAVAAAGMPPGVYRLGGADVLLSDDDAVPRSADGTIAGSALTLDRAVRNIISIGVDPAVAFRAATIIPADTIGEPAMGRIEVGALADLVLWGDDLRPTKVWVEGKLVYDKETSEPDTPTPHRETAAQPS